MTLAARERFPAPCVQAAQFRVRHPRPVTGTRPGPTGQRDPVSGRAASLPRLTRFVWGLVGPWQALGHGQQLREAGMRFELIPVGGGGVVVGQVVPVPVFNSHANALTEVDRVFDMKTVKRVSPSAITLQTP